MILYIFYFKDSVIRLYTNKQGKVFNLADWSELKISGKSFYWGKRNKSGKPARLSTKIPADGLQADLVFEFVDPPGYGEPDILSGNRLVAI